MKRLASGLTAALLATAAIAAPAFAETRSYDFKTFSRLDIAAGYEVVFIQGAQRSVTIESEDFSKVEARQDGNTLVIGRPQHTNLRGRVHDVVRITAPSLEAIELSAGVKFATSALNVGDIKLDLSAGVEADMSGVRAKRIDLDTSAGVTVKLAGECQDLHVDASAGVTVKAEDLRCRTADVDASAGSSVRVSASDKVNADAGVGASIRVAGKPKDVDKHISLGGSISVD